MPNRPEGEFKHSRLILCEGPDDVTFLSELIKFHSLPTSHIRFTGSTRADRGGKSRFGEKLKRLRTDRGFRRRIRHILIVADSDENEDGSFRGIRRQIANADYVAPTALRQAGIGSPQISVFLIPPAASGCLECYLKESMQAADPNVAALVDAFVDDVTKGVWSDVQEGKLWFRAALAAFSQNDPCINLAPALLRRNQNVALLDHVSLNGLVTFLRTFGL